MHTKSSYRNGHLKVVKFLLLNSRVDVNAISTIGWTPLHFACEYVSMKVYFCMRTGACSNSGISSKELRVLEPLPPSSGTI